MGTVEYRLRYTEEYLLETLSHHRRQLWWRGSYYLLKGVLAALIALLTVLAFVYRLFVLAMILSAILGALLLGPPIDSWFARKRLRKSPFYNNDLTFRISADGLHVTGKNEDARLKWSAFSKARRFSDGLLLFQGPHFFHWLPDKAAVDATSVAGAQELARTQVKDYRDV